MASLIKRAGVYYVAWREGRRQRRKSLDTTSKREATKRLDAWKRRATSDQWHGQTGNPTVEEFLKRWKPWAEKSLKRKTRETQLQRFADFMEWADAKRLGSASRQDVQRFAERLIESGRNRTTANNYLRDISALYGHAIKTFEMYGGPNPAQGVKRFKTEQSPPHYLEVPEIQTLLEVARAYDGEHTTRLEWFFSLGIYAGLRLDEIGHTQWGWFDWDGKLLSVPSR